MKFGVFLHPYSVTYKQIMSAALYAEKLGFNSIWIPDHLQRGQKTVIECWSTICALAAISRRIRIGSLATCNSFRNPSLLARIVSTASDISDGRVDITLGLGYDKIEHIANGYMFPSYNDRLSALSESVYILDSLLKNGKSTFNGKFYKMDSALNAIKPKLKLKVWLAGRNEQVLRLAATRAYGASILPYSGVYDERQLSSLDELTKICGLLDSFAGGKIVPRSIFGGDGGTVIGSDESDYSKRLRRYARWNRQEVKEATRNIENLSLLHGTVRKCSEIILRLSSLHFEEMVLYFPGWQSGDYSNMEVFAKEFL